MKNEFVMFHCYNKKKDLHDEKDCLGSFGMLLPPGLDRDALLSLCLKYIPCPTKYIKFNRTIHDVGFITHLEIEEMK